MSQPKKPLTATKLRAALTVSLFVVAVGAGAGFYFANRQLQSYASGVSESLAQADSSQDSLQTLQNIQRELKDNQDAIKRTAQIVADSKSYQYQNQIIDDLNDYAKRAGITITNIDFSDTTKGSTSASSSAPASGSAPTGLTPAAVPGAKSTFVSITLKNPVNYNSLLNFMHSTEQNLTKMQIASVNISKDASTPTGVTSNVLTLEVYIR